MEKTCVIFVIKKLYLVSFLVFIWRWVLNFLNFLDYGWILSDF